MFGGVRKREQDLDREVGSYQELEAEERETHGASAEEARYAARRAFGNTSLVKEATSEMWGWTSLDRFAQDVRDSGQVFERAAAMRQMDLNYTGETVPLRLQAAAVSAEWFDVFGAKPYLGRVFRTEEDQPGANRIAILTHAAWVRLMGADPNVLGRTIGLNQRPYEIVGVMRLAFAWPRPVDLWIPLALLPEAFTGANRFNAKLFAWLA